MTMESFDTNNHLPPRKRLLAELKRENSEFDYPPPVHFVSGDLGARLRVVVNSPSSSPDEIIEASNSIALAAAEIATAARNSAIEKAAAATKARAAAKNALLLLDSITMNRNSRQDHLMKNKVRKRQIPIKLLYKTNHPVRNQETDEELARKLHRVINSSPRITNNKEKSTDCFGKEGPLYNNEFVCYENSHVLPEESFRTSDECFVGNSEDISDCPKADIFGDEEDNGYCIDKRQNGSTFRSIGGARRLRLKQKKLPLSQCNIRDTAEQKRSTLSASHSCKREAKLDSAENDASSDDAELSPDGDVSMKITSAWKCKKIRASQCSSDGKILRAFC